MKSRDMTNVPRTLAEQRNWSNLNFSLEIDRYLKCGLDEKLVLYK